MEKKFPSKIAKESYPDTLTGQIAALKNSGQLAEYRKYREKHKNDRWEPAFHFSAPDGMINDPNGLCVWNGIAHLFYQAYPPADPRQHWGHAVSRDMVNWADLPLAIYPDIEYAVYSGSAYVEEERVIAMYHGAQSGNMIAIASDPLLLNWEKHSDNPVIPLLPDSEDGKPYRVFDPFLWKEKDGYYALSGEFYGPEGTRKDGPHNRMVEHLFFSQDLSRWIYLGQLIDDNPFIEIGNDGACPYFWPVGDKHVLFFFSHQTGPYALVGDYDKVLRKFTPEKKIKFNFGPVGCSSLQAPCVCQDGEGGLYLIFNTKDANYTLTRKGAMTLMIRVTLENGELAFRPIEAVKTLWDVTEVQKGLQLSAFEPVKLDTRSGMFDLRIAFTLRDAHAVNLRLFASDDGREYTSITVYKLEMKRGVKNVIKLFLTIDTTNASLSPDVQGRVPESCEIPYRENGIVELRVFADKCMVEVFANDSQYLMQMVYPTLPDADGITISALGGVASADIELHTIKPMKRELPDLT